MVYCIASLINGREYLAFSVRQPFGPLCFRNIAEAKRPFQLLYKALTTEAKNSPNYLFHAKRLARSSPVIVGIDQSAKLSLQTISKAMANNIPYGGLLFPEPHYIIELKSGFISKYQQLDIRADIESITQIVPDGSIGLQVFREIKDKADSSRHAPFTTNHANEILRDRGFI